MSCIKTLCWLCRTWSNFRGRWWLIRRIRGHPGILARIGPRQVFVRSIGAYMVTDASDFIGTYLYVEGMYEEACLRIFQALCSPGDCVLDIGANIGYFTLAASRLVGSTGLAMSFEPIPEVCSKLRGNIALNRHGDTAKTVVFQRAVCDVNEEIWMNIASSTNSGMSSMREIPQDVRVSRVAMKAITLDSMLDSIPKVKLVKIDVEGAEMKVLQGSKKLLERDAPFLVLELSDLFLQQLDSSAEEICKELWATGYDIFRINGGLRRLDRAVEEQCNVLCAHQTATIPAELKQLLVE